MNGRPDDRVAQAEAHVRYAEQGVQQQKEIVARFEAIGDAEEVRVAREVLTTLEKSLELARDGLRLLQRNTRPKRKEHSDERHGSRSLR